MSTRGAWKSNPGFVLATDRAGRHDRGRSRRTRDVPDRLAVVLVFSIRQTLLPAARALLEGA